MARTTASKLKKTLKKLEEIANSDNKDLAREKQLFMNAEKFRQKLLEESIKASVGDHKKAAPLTHNGKRVLLGREVGRKSQQVTSQPTTCKRPYHPKVTSAAGVNTGGRKSMTVNGGLPSLGKKG